MTRGLATGDKHLGLSSDGFPRLDEQRRILDFCIKTLDADPRISLYVDLGDLFDQPRPGPDAHAEGVRYATALADWRAFDPDLRRAYILRGNHDVTSRGGLSALEPVTELGRTDKHFPRVVSEPLAEQLGDLLLVFLPHLTPADAGGFPSAQERLDAFCDEVSNQAALQGLRILAFAHLEVRGSKTSEWDTRQRETGVFIPESLLKSKSLLRVYAGHIHRFQRVGKVTVVGSGVHVDFGEALDVKCIVGFEVADA